MSLSKQHTRKFYRDVYPISDELFDRHVDTTYGFYSPKFEEKYGRESTWEYTERSTGKVFKVNFFGALVDGQPANYCDLVLRDTVTRPYAADTFSFVGNFSPEGDFYQLTPAEAQRLERQNRLHSCGSCGVNANSSGGSGGSNSGGQRAKAALQL